MIALRLTLLATAAFAAPAAEADADPQFLLGHGLPTCTDVEHVVPAVGYYGKREAEADPQLLVGAPYVAHAITKVTTKHCVPGAPILEDVTTDVTKCVPKSVCEDVTAEVLEPVCGEPAAEAEAVEEA